MLNILPAFASLVALLYAGEWLSERLPIYLPGPLIGLLLLFFILVILGRVPAGLEKLCQMLLQHLSVLFVPATLGIVIYQQQLAKHPLIILSALIISTIVSMYFTALLSQYLENRKLKKDAN